jgi:hypothetical protein
MKKFESKTCKVEFSVEELKLKNQNSEKPVVETVKSKSELFRKLYDCGMEICEISRECGSHYSFVYGVISQSRDVRTVKTESKSDLIRSMVDDGQTPGQIAKTLNSNYSFVFSVVKKYKSSEEYTEKQSAAK